VESQRERRPLGRPRHSWVYNTRIGFGGKPEGKEPLGRPRRRWVDNIRMDLVEVGWGRRS
jgi:hypothetical protein